MESSWAWYFAPDPGARPWRAVNLQRTADGSQPVGEPAQPRALLGPGPPGPRVADLHNQRPLRRGEFDGGTARPGVLGHVGQSLRDHEVRRRLYRWRIALVGHGTKCGWDRAAFD